MSTAEFRGAPPIRRTRDLIPQSLLFYVGHRYYKAKLSGFIKAKFPGRYRHRPRGPLPPNELIATEALMREEDLRPRSKPDWYFGCGCRDALQVLEDLDRNGFPLVSLRRLVELGCGSSRVLRWFRVIDGLELHGSDANPKPVEWGRSNLTGIDFHHNALEPPLALADGCCDVIYALSVFTHIPLDRQAAWIREMWRVLRPGGYAVCTVAGSPYISTQLQGRDREIFEKEGRLTLDANSPHASYSSQLLGSWDVFQSREDVRRSFSVGFEILSYTDQRVGQDRLVLRRDDGRLGAPRAMA